MLLKRIFYSFCRSFGWFKLFCAVLLRGFCVVKVTRDRALASTCTTRIRAGRRKTTTHTHFDSFLHLFQVFASTHEILHFSIVTRPLFFAFLFLKYIVGSYYFFSAYFQFIWCLDFDKIIFGRFQLSVYAWRLGHWRRFFWFLRHVESLYALFGSAFGWLIPMTVLHLLGYFLIIFSSTELLFLESVYIILTTLLKGLFFFKFRYSFLIQRSVEWVADCRFMRFWQRWKK